MRKTKKGSKYTEGMAGPRKLGRPDKHRRALLRNLVTALFEHESITTTHAKAKETQRVADRLLSIAKKENKDHAVSLISSDIFKHGQILPKIFGELKDRYKNRAGGFTRVLKLEPRLGDNAPQSIVELVDGGREMKFWLLARVVARLEQQEVPIDPLTKSNVERLLKFRQNGEKEFRDLVERMKTEFYSDVETLKQNLPSMDENTTLGSPYGKSSRKTFTIVPRPARE